MENDVVYAISTQPHDLGAPVVERTPEDAVITIESLIRDAIDQQDERIITVKVYRTTKAELDALPEFGGW